MSNERPFLIMGGGRRRRAISAAEYLRSHMSESKHGLCRNTERMNTDIICGMNEVDIFIFSTSAQS